MRPAEIWKPTNKHFIRNPYPVYKEIRKDCSVFQSNAGDYVILNYHDCKHILQDASFGTGLRLSWVEKMSREALSRGTNLNHLVDAVAGMLVQINPPEQQAIKSDLAKSWPGIDELKKVSNEVITEALDELPAHFDAVSLLCRKIPLTIISTLLGLPRNQSEEYAMDGINLVQVLSPYLTYRDIQRIGESTHRLQSFLTQHLRANDYVPTKLTALLIDQYPAKEMINLLLFIFIAGYETTSTLLTLCLYHLIKDKTHLSNIEKYGTRPFINEILRRYSPVQITGRTNTEAVELGGTIIPKNSALTVCLGAANVDPNQFDRPDEMVWDRSKREHLSFGYGLHYCLGNQLAEIEAEILIEKLIPMVDKLSVADEPVLRDQYTITSYQSFNLNLK